MKANENGTFQNGVRVDEINDILLKALFVGSTERTIPVWNSTEEKGTPKYHVTYVPIDSEGESFVAPLHEFQMTEASRERTRVLVETAWMIRKINGKSLAKELFTLNLYLEHEDDSIVKKSQSTATGKIERDLEKSPLSDFEKSYLVVKKMPQFVVEMFHANMTNDRLKLMDTFVDKPEEDLSKLEDAEKEKKRSRAGLDPSK